MAKKKGQKGKKTRGITTRTAKEVTVVKVANVLEVVLVKQGSDTGTALREKVKNALDNVDTTVFEKHEAVIVQVNGVGNGNDTENS